MATKKPAEEPQAEDGQDPTPEAPKSEAQATDDGPVWQEGYRSALDDPAHPLHHLRNT